MNEQAFGTLEFAALRALVRREARTPLGQNLVDALVPLSARHELQTALDAVGEAEELKRRTGALWSFSELAEPSETLERLRIAGAQLDPLALRETARLVEQSLAARALIATEREACPTLWAMVGELAANVLQPVATRILEKITPSGELDDRASPELARLRHEINVLRSRITRALENLMRRESALVQDELVTVRNDRFVIPIKADHRARLGGVAHGFSSSGQTVFLEPLETIEANNEMQTLRETEEREIARILNGLTDELRRVLPELKRAATAVAELDFVAAKARFAEKFNCTVPVIDDGATLELVEARHPLLEENLRELEREVVPVSFTLDAATPVMVISGANAGGKTVVLKTAGLLSLMALSGLPVPARRARIPLYHAILADIGDQQSLAANLSTFTSHIANIARMIEICRRQPALVLIDEAGTGTDPEEGSALGVAVTDHFRRTCGAHVIASTHYRGLKMYAANEAGVLNASVEFNERTLQPTYRLLTGVAGASSGLEIARRFGIPDAVIDAARANVETSALEAAEYLQRIKRESEQAESLRLALEEERAAVAERYAGLAVKAHARERERQKEVERELLNMIDDFAARGQEITAQIEDRIVRERAQREAQERIRELKTQAKRAAASVTVATTAPAVAAAKDNAGKNIRVMRDGKIINASPAEDATDEISALQGDRTLERPPVKGDRVRLKSFGSTGIVEAIKGKDAEVLVGAMRLRQPLSALETLAPPVVKSAAAPQDKKPQTLGERLQAQHANSGAQVKLGKARYEDARELKLLGFTVDEALDEADKFLDEAYLHGETTLRIVHGIGTGALRRAIHDFLRKHPHVAGFTTPPREQGGEGATIVEIK